MVHKRRRCRKLNSRLVMYSSGGMAFLLLLSRACERRGGAVTLRVRAEMARRTSRRETGSRGEWGREGEEGWRSSFFCTSDERRGGSGGGRRSPIRKKTGDEAIALDLDGREVKWVCVHLYGWLFREIFHFDTESLFYLQNTSGIV